MVLGMGSCLVCVGMLSDDGAAAEAAPAAAPVDPGPAPPPLQPVSLPQPVAAPVPAAPTEEDQALAFFLQAVANCPNAAHRGPGSRVVQSRGGSIFKVLDGANRTMLVHLSARLVYSPKGPNGPMPAPYTFCNPRVFVGTMDE
ncbi:MAG: hypothetical protein KC731_43045 [Myxococcales bacterium]|nr:hypothetical protein [Myxococcales bacterium]